MELLRIAYRQAGSEGPPPTANHRALGCTHPVLNELAHVAGCFAPLGWHETRNSPRRTFPMTKFGILLLTLTELLASTGCAVRSGYYAEPAFYAPPPIAYVQPYPGGYYRERVVVAAPTPGYGYGYVRPYGYGSAHAGMVAQPGGGQRGAYVPQGRDVARPGVSGRSMPHRTAANPRMGRR